MNGVLKGGFSPHGDSPIVLRFDPPIDLVRVDGKERIIYKTQGVVQLVFEGRGSYVSMTWYCAEPKRREAQSG